MICKSLLATLLVLLGHRLINDSRYTWSSTEPETTESNNVIIVIDPKEYVRGGPIRGSALVHGTSSFADEAAFAKQLAALLKGHDRSLQNLEPSHITISRSTAFQVVSRDKYILGSHGQFIPQQAHLDFRAHFDHHRGISRYALQDALRHVSEETSLWVEPAVESVRLLSEQEPNLYALEEACKIHCSEFVTYTCENCKASDVMPNGTFDPTNQATCTCIYSNLQLATEIGSYMLWGVFMCITGCICWPNYQREQRLETIQGTGEFDSLCGKDCLMDSNTCLMGCFCPAVRAANTYHTALIGEFFPMLFIIATLYSIPIVGSFVVFVVFCTKRGSLRTKAGMLSDSNCGDCLLTFLCSECTTCQEARFIEKMRH